MSVRQEQLEAAEEIEEVAPGVLRAQIPIVMPGLGHVNCYVIEDGQGVTLVDPGLPDPDSHVALVTRLRRAGIPPERIHTVIVTHSHPDHFGGAGRLRVEHDCHVMAHETFSTPYDARPVDTDLVELDPAAEGHVPGLDDVDLSEVDLPEVDGPVNRRLAALLFGDGDLSNYVPRAMPWGEEGFRPNDGELAWMRSWDDLSKKGLLSLTPTVRVTDEEWVRIGDRDWQVIHTPGHTGDHLCLFDPEAGVLLSGDHVLPTITPHISGLTPAEDSLAEFIGALHRVAAVEGVELVLPAHGLPFTDLAGRVQHIVEHHDERLARIEGISAELGTATVRSVSRELFAERSWGPMAESETYAHLEHLRIQGRMASSRDTEGRLLYTLVAGEGSGSPSVNGDPSATGSQ